VIILKKSSKRRKKYHYTPKVKFILICITLGFFCLDFFIAWTILRFSLPPLIEHIFKTFI
jgi:hypothetical protein